MNGKHIGNFIKFKREELGLTIEQFCATLGVPRSIVESWEKGEIPETQYLVPISRVLHASVDELLKGRQENEEEKVESVMVTPALKTKQASFPQAKQNPPTIQEEKGYYDIVVSKRIAKGKKFIFFFYAIKDGYVFSHHKDVFNTNKIRFYTNEVNVDGFYRLEPFICKVLSNRLVSKTELVKCLNDDYCFNTTEGEHYADFYYVLQVEVVEINTAVKELDVSSVNSTNGNDTYSVHSPKIVDLSAFDVI